MRRDTVVGLLLVGLMLAVGVTAPDREPLSVESVTLRTTGGLAGVNETVRINSTSLVRESELQDGGVAAVNASQRFRLLRIANGDWFRNHPGNATYGCEAGYGVADALSHTLIIRYDRGVTRIELTCGLGQHSAAPQAVKEVVRTVQQIESESFNR